MKIVVIRSPGLLAPFLRRIFGIKKPRDRYPLQKEIKMPDSQF